MKMRICLGLLFLLGLQSLNAQNVLKGRVTDKKGNPISGAKVEDATTMLQTTTDMNGEFSLESDAVIRSVNVYYMGMQTVHKNAEQGMLVKMRNTTWWNKKPDKASWFISAQGAFSESGLSNASFGLMAGKVKKIGWYVKGVYSPSESTDVDYVNYPDDSDKVNWWTTGKNKHSYWSATVGAMYRLECPIYAYAGIGYSERKVAGELADGTYAKNTDSSFSGATIDLGLMLKVKWFVVNCGTQAIFSNGCNFVGNVGVGVSF